MTQLFALLLPLASWHAASTLSRRTRQGPTKDLVSRFFLAAAIFLTAFHLLGFIQLLTGWAVVRIDLAAILVAAVAIALRLSTARTATASPSSCVAVLASFVRRLRQQPALMAMASCVLVTHALLVASVLSAPPRGYDALWYHLPNVLRIYVSHTLELQLGSYIELYPLNGELFGLPLLTLHNDSWVGLLQYPWLLVVAALTGLLAHRAGAGANVAVAASLTVLTVPLPVFQAQRFYVDVIHAALSLGSLLYLIDWIRRRRRFDLVLCALTLSIMLGTKYIAVLPWLFVVAIASWAAVSGDRGAQRTELSRLVGWRVVVVIVGLGTAFTWLWWARNLAATGNPIAPIRVGYLAATLWQGRTLGSVFAPPVSWSDVLGSLVSSYGTVVVLVPAALTLALQMLRGRRIGRADVTVLALAYAAWGVLSFVVFLSQDPRFLIAPFAVIVVAATAWLGQLERRGVALLLVLTLGNTVYVLHQLGFAGNFDVSLISSSRNSFYGLPDEIDRLPAGARLLLRGHPALAYPAAGARRQTVVYPSPMGAAAAEIALWEIDYVFVRSTDPAKVTELQRLPSLRMIRANQLPAHLWWDYWPDRRPRFTALFEVVEVVP